MDEWSIAWSCIEQDYPGQPWKLEILLERPGGHPNASICFAYMTSEPIPRRSDDLHKWLLDLLDDRVASWGPECPKEAYKQADPIEIRKQRIDGLLELRSAIANHVPAELEDYLRKAHKRMLAEQRNARRRENRARAKAAASGQPFYW